MYLLQALKRSQIRDQDCSNHRDDYKQDIQSKGWGKQETGIKYGTPPEATETHNTHHHILPIVGKWKMKATYSDCEDIHPANGDYGEIEHPELLWKALSIL